MDDLRFMSILTSFESYKDGGIIMGWDDNESLRGMELCLRLRRFRLERGSNSGPLDQ